MTRAIDLSLRHFTHTHGDIFVIGSWISIEGRHRPCLILIRTGDENNEHCIPCVMTSDKAWIWSEAIGDPRQAAQMAAGFIQALRLNEHDQRNFIRIASIIHDHLGDLLHIPPYTAPQSEVVAEILVTDQRTGKTREVEIRDDV
ncbi:hypothetical protein LJR231_001578 [Phyllobacterium sp. LjRoot231]|uniref:hypothetical protein n=1 Tax=Phyllobacterium sp. LjRoot231 TaxID=3342289 RepID=UPI003ECF4305